MSNVDIILPTYNCEKTIDETINSVINQSFKDWNLIVIDDASTDSTAIQIKQYLKDNRVSFKNCWKPKQLVIKYIGTSENLFSKSPKH